MKTALVLGGAGFLGRNLIPKLVERGYEVTSVDLEYSRVPKIQGVECSHMNVEDWLDDTYEERFDYVFHLAAGLTKLNIAERNQSNIWPFEDMELDAHLAKWLLQFPAAGRVVWMSSAAVDAKDTENYAFVKYVGERFGKTLARAGIPITILKPYGGYGPGQSENYPMTAIIDRALRKEDPLIVWGNVHTVRDWIYVDDVVEAMLMAAEEKFLAPGAWPIGTGIGTTFGDLARQVAEQVGYSPKVKADFTKPVGSLHRVAETSLAKLCGFEAKVKLADGIAKCIEARRGSNQ